MAPPRKSDLDPGTLVNGIYRLVRLLGIVGMGEVWEARHERTKGRVALKLLLPEMGRHPDVLLRFQREVEITSGLNHPNIVRVSDADKLPNGRPFLVMEFLDGQDLAKLTGKAMPFDAVVEIIEQTAMGLHAAHSHSVIHRDLKPANLFVVPLPGTTRSLIKILDFGISKALDGLSKLTQTHSVMGTPYYMAPEEARGGISSMDGRADQFSLASIAYELLTGRMAFEGDGTLNVIFKVVTEDPPAFAALGISAPPGVEAVLTRALSKSADARFASVLEFSDALKAAGRGRGLGRTEVAMAPVAAAKGASPAPKAVAARGGAAGTPQALATPRTLRLPDGPRTTLRGGTGELAVEPPPAVTPSLASAPAGRYAASGGVVHDNRTGLNWQQDVAPATYAWDKAVTYCSSNAAALAGTGWRLPTVKELETLVDDTVPMPGPTIDTSFFPATPAGSFWVSTPYAPSPSSASWSVGFNFGGTFHFGVASLFNVRCVR